MEVIELKRIMVFPLFFIFVVTFANGAIAPTHVVPTVEPGDKDVPLYVQVQNVGSKYEMKSIVLRLHTKYPFTVARSYGDISYIGNLEPGATAWGEFYIDVNDNAKEGIYILDMDMEYIDESGVEHNERRSINVKVETDAKLSVTGVWTYPERLKPGDIFSLFINIKNVGKADVLLEKARIDTTYTKDPSQGIIQIFPLMADTKTYLEVINPGEIKTLRFDLVVHGNAKSQPMPLKFDVWYEKEKKIRASIPSTEAVETAEGGQAQVTPTTYPTISAEDLARIYTGTMRQEDIIRMMYSQPSGAGIGGIFGMSLPSFGGFESLSQAMSATYPAAGETPPTETQIFGIVIEGEPDFSIRITEFKTEPSPGGVAEFSMDVSNIGTADARFLEVKPIIKSPIVKIVPEEGVFIGTLSPDDFDSVDFKITLAREVKPGVYPFSVELRYRDTYNRIYTVTKTTYFEVTGLKETAGFIGRLKSIFNLKIGPRETLRERVREDIHED